MGGAEADGQVPAADPDATIDGAESRGAESSSARPLPGPIVGAIRDHTELLEVDRGRYAIARELAKGGMGRVYEARDLRLGRQVAIKELLPKNRDIARRFEREARITARLQHPSIIHVYEAGVWPGGEPFYAMPLVAGRSLDEVVAEKATLAERLALLPRVIAVADALAYAHNANVIHRDLKPSNVLVGEFGETVVIDWGLAKDLGVQTDPKESMRLPARARPEETASGSVVGTPAYMPPEQARGEGADQRSDVYALGALLYKLLSGAAPYQGGSTSDVLAQVKARAPIAVGERVPDAPPELVAIVTKAMAREPRDRYVSAAELAQDLKLFETGQLVGAHRYTAGQLVGRWLRRYRVPVTIAAIAIVTLAVVGAVSVQNVVAARDRAEARRVALLEERARTELLAGHAGAALAYLVGAAHDGVTGGARGFLIAEAMRPFQAETAVLMRDRGNVVIAVSPDGTHVASASSGRVELSSPTGARQRVLTDRGGASVLAFDDAGAELAAAGNDGVVRVWRLDGTLVGELKVRAIDLAFSSDGRLATAGADGVAQVWDLETLSGVTADCKRLPTEAPSPALLTVRFDASGKLAAAGAEDGTGCVWETHTGDEVAPLRGHTKAIEAIRWSPDGSWLATASEDGTARVWSPTFGKAIVVPMQHGHPVEAAEVSADGTRLVTGDDEGGVRIWQIPRRLPSGEDGGIRVPARGGAKLESHTNRIVAIAFSANGDLVATAGADRLVTVWEASTGQPVARIEQADALTSIAFAGDRIVTGSRDGTAHVLEPRAPRPHIVDSPVYALAVSRAGVVAVGGDDSFVRLLEPAPETLRGHLGKVYAAAFTPDGSTLVTAGDDASPIAWDVASRTPHALAAATGPYRAIAVAPDGDHVATAGVEVRLWSLKTRTSRVLDSRGVKIGALAYSPSGDRLVGGAGDGTLVTWDSAGAPLATAHTIPLTALAFAPDGHTLAVGGVAQAGIYRVDGMTRVTTIESAPGEVDAMLFACDGACLVTANEAGTVQVWDAAKGKLLAVRDPHAGPVSALALSDKGTRLWVATEGRSVGWWDVHVETRPASALDCFMARSVPWHLGADDVATQGGLHAERGSDCK